MIVLAGICVVLSITSYMYSLYIRHHDYYVVEEILYTDAQTWIE